MFSFGNEVLITEIINAIERKEAVRARFFPALLLWEPGLGSLFPRSELSGDTRAEGMLSLLGWGNALLDALFLPCILVTPV